MIPFARFLPVFGWDESWFGCDNVRFYPKPFWMWEMPWSPEFRSWHQLVYRLNKAYCQSDIGIPGGWVYCPYQVCPRCQSSLAVKYWPLASPSLSSWSSGSGSGVSWMGQLDSDEDSCWTCLTDRSLGLAWERARSPTRVRLFVPSSIGQSSEWGLGVYWVSKVCQNVPFRPWSSLGERGTVAQKTVPMF